MKLTTYGYRRPEIDDRDFWDSIDFDILRLDSHNHDGKNSSFLAPSAARAHEFFIAEAAWVGASPGPWTKEFFFPIEWEAVWVDGGACPVQVTVYDPTGNVVYLDMARGLDGLSFILTTSVKTDYMVGIR